MPTLSPVTAETLPTPAENLRRSLGHAWKQADQWARANPREALLFGVAGGVGIGLIGLGAVIRAAARYRPLLVAAIAQERLSA